MVKIACEQSRSPTNLSARWGNASSRVGLRSAFGAARAATSTSESKAQPQAHDGGQTEQEQDHDDS